MSKWFGKVGYQFPATETSPGIWESGGVVEHEYYGDIISDRRKRQNFGEINDTLNLADVVSILADPFAYDNCSRIVYVEIMRTRWKVTEIDPSQRPRLILTVGGEWYGDTPRSSDEA